MSEKNLSDVWNLKKRGKRDSARHKELLKKAIKENSKKIITQYDLITTDGDKKIKIPIRFLDHYRFKFGGKPTSKGVGQGLSGKKGQKYKVVGGKDGGPGDEAGTQHYEDEVTIDEMVEIILEDLNLPWLKPNEESIIETKEEVFSSIEKKGLMSNLDIKRTLINNIKRNIATKNDKVIGDFANEDLRFKDWESEHEYASNANIYMMMDVSGSMVKSKRDIAKTFYFWMVQFLKRKYKNISLYFIVHDTQAKFVNQKEFFTISAAGGTSCSSAFALARDHILEHHSEKKYNNYVFEFSDGDNTQTDSLKCVEIINEFISNCRAIGYGEILGDVNNIWLDDNRELLSDILRRHIQRTRLVSLSFQDKSDVFDNLKKFFNIKDGEKVE
tara:strand:- start:3432 stop:4589 length:1158 start_codon:yes stop_codon:yes gene_type:complete